MYLANETVSYQNLPIACWTYPGSFRVFSDKTYRFENKCCDRDRNVTGFTVTSGN
ncbi:hypothetical protein [Geitlerinema sp. PCC 9228]|uniref:hypothetical protein n=1 Tax=Geitlerinema sp. PCC 9228 TaxID=111611 RepID=UPI00147C88CA|nr:hypothetical protein [Geitlerinema sp. PCC 9228]